VEDICREVRGNKNDSREGTGVWRIGFSERAGGRGGGLVVYSEGGGGG
jgi:hypothetical protein